MWRSRLPWTRASLYRDSEELSEENKSTYTIKLRCIKCKFEFDPFT